MTHADLRERIAKLVGETVLPAAPGSLRAVGATWNDRRIRLVCYLHGYITEDVRTALHDASSRIMEAFLGERRVFVEVQQLDRPAPVPEDAAVLVLYCRHEVRT